MSNIKVTKFRKKIWGFHCDVYQHVNNARYLEFLEEARWEFTRPLKENEVFQKKNWITIVVHLEISYKKPLLLNDEIEIHTCINEKSRKTMTFNQKIYKNKGKDLCCEAKIKFVVYDNINKKTLFINEEIEKMFNE